MYFLFLNFMSAYYSRFGLDFAVIDLPMGFLLKTLTISNTLLISTSLCQLAHSTITTEKRDKNVQKKKKR